VKANGHTARAMIDTATIGVNLVSSNFCFQKQISLLQRKKPLEMSMTVKGSKTKSDKEVVLTLSLNNKKKVDCKFQVIAIDKWDMILGMPFLSKHFAVITLGNDPSVYLPDLKVYLTLYSQFQPSTCRTEVLSITQQKFNSIQDSPQKQDFDPIREYPELFPDKRPLTLPPSRGDMDHRITLIDPDKKINPPMIPVPEKYRHQLLEKLEGDLHAGRIYPSKSDQASTMFCVPKPDNPEKARFITDLRQRNDNTVKDHYPIQHQDTIINQIARAKYRSKIDLHESFF
jgi:hypothetical protein